MMIFEAIEDEALNENLKYLVKLKRIKDNISFCDANLELEIEEEEERVSSIWANLNGLQRIGKCQ